MSDDHLPIKINRIAQIALVVDDLPIATAFYRDMLGLTFLFDAPGISFFDCNGVRLMLSLAETKQEPPAPAPGPTRAPAPTPAPASSLPSSIIYFAVPNLKAAHQSLQDAGIEFIAAPHIVHRTEFTKLWMAFLNDPAGNSIGLMCEVAIDH